MLTVLQSSYLAHYSQPSSPHSFDIDLDRYPMSKLVTFIQCVTKENEFHLCKNSGFSEPTHNLPTFTYTHLHAAALPLQCGQLCPFRESEL